MLERLNRPAEYVALSQERRAFFLAVCRAYNVPPELVEALPPDAVAHMTAALRLQLALSGEA